MPSFRILFFAIVLLSGTSAAGQADGKFKVEKDLQGDWLVFKHNTWTKWEGEETKAIYLIQPASFFKGRFIGLRSLRPIHVFINQKLVIEKPAGLAILNMDSLSGGSSSGITLGIYQQHGIDLLSGSVLIPVDKNAPADQTVSPRRGQVFLNFSILAVLLLAIAFILLFRTNPKLTLDYLNVPRLFTIQEREDTLLTSRVTSSVNLLFYLFCSAFFALNLLTIFYFGPDSVNGARYFPVRSVAEGFFQWIKLIVIVAVCLFLKLTLIYSFSTLFKLRDSSALQFFNFIRMTFFISVLISVISLGYFIFYGYPTGPDVGLLKMTMVVMSVSAVMIFLKLLSLAPFSFFHLFSYLCASEIIPLVILLKVLLY